MSCLRNLTSWVSDDKRILMILSATVLSVFDEYQQHKLVDTEAGGVLLGHRRASNFEVVHATRPLPTDKRTRFSFVRESAGHQEQATRLWSSSKHQMGYLGEWHTHPEPYPRPSQIDIEQWRESASEMAGHLPFLAVIVGQKHLYAAVWTHGRPAQEFQIVER